MCCLDISYAFTMLIRIKLIRTRLWVPVFFFPENQQINDNPKLWDESKEKWMTTLLKNSHESTENSKEGENTLIGLFRFRDHRGAAVFKISYIIFQQQFWWPRLVCKSWEHHCKETESVVPLQDPQWLAETPRLHCSMGHLHRREFRWSLHYGDISLQCGSDCKAKNWINTVSNKSPKQQSTTACKEKYYFNKILERSVYLK